MRTETCATYWARIYMSGPIEVAKQAIREDCMREGLCVTVEPTTFIYTGGEEVGFVVGLVNYPRFPSSAETLRTRAEVLMETLLLATHQHSAMLMLPDTTLWVSRREENAAPIAQGENAGAPRQAARPDDPDLRGGAAGVER